MAAIMHDDRQQNEHQRIDHPSHLFESNLQQREDQHTKRIHILFDT